MTTLKRLSAATQDIDNLHKRQRFVQEFRKAVAQGTFLASLTNETFEYEMIQRKRGDRPEARKTLSAPEMVFEDGESYQEWFKKHEQVFDRKTHQLASQPTAEELMNGATDFEANAEHTRQRLASLYERGHRLGQSKSAGNSARKEKTLKQ